MADLIGQRLGQYEIVALIGEGGMSSVYRARQVSMRRDVAVKVIESKLAHSPEFVKRFGREAQTVASLSHIHILKVFDYGQQRDLVYLVMELLTGGSLADLIHKGPLSPRETSRMLDQMASALDYAHGQGIIHRDLKPQNVLLDTQRNAHLTDFGIAKILSETTALTQSGAAMGTPAYMSPEQWQGRSLDARTDNYALGVMLFEMLTGRLPFSADTPASMMYMHLQEPPPSVCELQADLPLGIDQVIERALAKDRDQRYESASALAQAFKAALQDQESAELGSTFVPESAEEQAATEVVVPPSATPLPTAQQSRSSVIQIGIGLIVIILALMAIVAARSRIVYAPISQETSNAQTVGAAYATNQAVQTAVLDTETAIAAAASLSPTPLVTEIPSPTEMPSPTETPFPTSTNIPTPVGQLLQFSGHTGTINSVAFSPNGRYILSGSNDGTALLWDVQIGNQIREFTVPETATPEARLSRGAGAVADRFRVMSAGNLPRNLQSDEEKPSILSVAFSPDSRLALTGDASGTIRLWEVETAKEVGTFMGHTGGITGVAFSPDGRFILSGSEDGTGRLWDVRTATDVLTFSNASPVSSVAYSPDGNYVLMGGYSSTARLWSVQTGDEIRVFTGHSGVVNSVAFSPDGKYVLTGSEDNLAILWNLATGKAIRKFAHDSGVTSAAFSPGGRYILTGSYGSVPMYSSSLTVSMMTLWDMQTGKRLRRFMFNLAPEKAVGIVTSVAFSPDGQFVIGGGRDAEYSIRMWPIGVPADPPATPAPTPTPGGVLLTPSEVSEIPDSPLREFAGHADIINSVAFSSDGKYILSGSNDKTARLWNAQTGLPIHQFLIESGVLSVAFSPDGQLALIGGSEGSASIWDAQTGVRLRSLTGHGHGVNSVAFSPDGEFALTGSSDGTARLWDVKSGRSIQLLTDYGQITSVAFSPDGGYILTGSSTGIAKLWEFSGNEVAVFTGHKGTITSVAFSHDGNTILTGSDDKTARLWDVTGKELHTFTHASAVYSVAFSPGGSYVLTAGLGNQIDLWDAQTGRKLRQIKIPITVLESEFAVKSAVFSPDGRFILTGGGILSTETANATAVQLWSVGLIPDPAPTPTQMPTRPASRGTPSELALTATGGDTATPLSVPTGLAAGTEAATTPATATPAPR